MRAIVFSKAGKLALTKYVAGLLSQVPANMSIRNGTVQSIQNAVSYNTATLPDGNSDWPMGDFDIGADGKITVNMSSYQPELLAFLLGTTVEDLTDAVMMSIDEELVVPSATPFTATLIHTPNASITPIVTDDEATSFTKVVSDPAASQFMVSANVVTFNSADAGKQVFATYDWTAGTAIGFGLPKVVSRSVLHCVISSEATSEDESEIYDSNITIDRCKAVGDINPPEASREPKGWSFTLKVLKPRGTNKAVDYTLSKRV